MSRNLICSFFCIATLLFGSASAKDFPKGSPRFYESHIQGLAESKRTGKPLIVVVSAEWCPPCQMHVKQLYPSPEVASYHDRFVWVYLDSDKPQNRSGIVPLRVQGIPHISFLSSEGMLIGNTRGVVAPTQMAKILKDISSKHPAPKKNVSPDPVSSSAPSPGGGMDGEALLIPQLR